MADIVQMQTFGQKLRDLRKSRNLSQSQLAKKLGVGLMSVSFWERDTVEPSIFNAIAVADFFNISLDELCCREFEK